MGRKKKYSTIEEQRAAQRVWNKKFYSLNKEMLNKATMEKYYAIRKNIQSDSGESSDESS
jgi:hypothetical protein